MASDQTAIKMNVHAIDSTQPLSPLLLQSQSQSSNTDKLGIVERAFSAAGAAFLSAVIVNPLDVAKTRLQAQAAGVAYSHPLGNMTSRMACFGPNMMFADFKMFSIMHSGWNPWHRRIFYAMERHKCRLGTCSTNCRWEFTFHAMTYSATGWRNSPAKSAPITTPYVPLVAGSLARSTGLCNLLSY
ncbi:Mitochondrial substrate/solute carrier [Sesbania bispinosa]|nr:Mitochondrial substrate/solute carrier [Sesbania bispinosa]